MDVRLVVERGNAKPQTWRLHHKDNVIGRRRDCQLRILSAEVSRRHCLLTIEEGYVSVEDLDSINGTFLNGQRLAGKQVVRPGDRLEIGPVEFIVEYGLTKAARDRLEQQSAATVDVKEAEVLEVADEDVEAVAEDGAADAPFAFADNDAADWHLPETSDLRELLSQVEKPASPPRRRKT